MKLIYLFLFITILSACKKGQSDFTIKGTITDATYNQPLANATIYVTKTNQSGIESHLTTLQTDSEGNYSFTTKRDRFNSVNLSLSKNGYFEINHLVNFDELTLKNDNVINLSTTGKSWVKIILKHSASSSTIMDIVRTKGKSGCEECCPEGYRRFTGITDTFFYCINDAATKYEISYFKINTSFNGTKEVTTTFMDTVDLELNY